MPISESARSAAAIHRKVRALGAVFLDPAATEHEKANAKRLRARLEEHLVGDATPEGAWTGIMFRSGRGVKEIIIRAGPKGRLDRLFVPAWQNAPKRFQEVAAISARTAHSAHPRSDGGERAVVAPSAS
jgi:hypothetical protein